MKKKKNVKDAYDAYCDGSYDDFHELRDKFFQAVESNGFDGTLEALDFPTDRQAIWFNVHTGSEGSLEELLASRHELNDEVYELGLILENWLPKKEHPNPIIARSLALSEEDAIRQVIQRIGSRLEECQSAEDLARVWNWSGGTLGDGGYWVQTGKVKIDLHDGRVFNTTVKHVFDFGQMEKRQATLF